MNLGRARVVVRERNVLEVVDLSYRFVFALGGRLFLKLFLVTGLPSWALCFWALSKDVAVGWVWLLAVTLFWLVQAPFTIVASRLMFAEDASLGQALAPSIVALARALLALLVVGVLLAVGTLLIVPLPFIVSRTLYLREIVLLEGTGVFASLGRSGRFTRGRVGHALQVALILLAVTTGFMVLVTLLANALTHDVLGLDALGGLTEILRSPAALLGLFVAVPFVATARFLAYIDGRTRREAWDVQVRFLKLGLDEQARAA